jgi:hypothetical protein
MKLKIVIIASIVLITNCNHQVFEVLENTLDKKEDNERNLFNEINFNQVKESTMALKTNSNSLFDKFEDEDDISSKPVSPTNKIKTSQKSEIRNINLI